MTGTYVKAVSERVTRADLLQTLVAYLFILAFAMLVSWPSTALQPNNSWHALEQAQGVLLMLIGLGFGSVSGRFILPSRAVLLGALVLMVVFGLPFEIGAHTASLPGIPLVWPLLLTPLTLIAYFGLGLVLGVLVRALKLVLFLPLLIPMVIAGVFYLDLALGIPVFNPLLAARILTPGHVVTMSGLSVISIMLVVYMDRRAALAAPKEAVRSA